MILVGASGQAAAHYNYNASGLIVAANTPQLVLGRSAARTSLFIQNTSSGLLYVEIGGARATATLTNGQVTGFTIVNAGFGFTKPPIVRLMGGGNDLGGPSFRNPSYLGLNQPGGSSPSRPAKAHALLTSGTVSAIVIDDPGANYAIAPYVHLIDSDLDPYGCGVPSATGSMNLVSGGAVSYNGTVCPTDPVAIMGATVGQSFVCWWMQ